MHSNIIRLLAILTMLGMTVSASAQSGAEKAATCAACHGADGNSINPEWPSLAGQHPNYVVQQLSHYKDGVRENASMSPMAANLSIEDMQEIAEFYAAKPPKIGTIAVEDIASGEKIYRGGNAKSGVPACMACHGPNGAGNRAANYPALRGQHAKYTVIQLQAYRDGTRTTGLNEIMQTIARKMTDSEIESVSKYINALY